jgi:large conductance mechanosensitive channel
VLKDFKAFVLRGNVVDLAVGIVIGAAFKSVIDSLVGDVFTPLLTVPGTRNFADLQFTMGGGVVKYGQFLNNVLSFVTIAAVVFFVIVRPLNALMARHKTEPEVESTTKKCGHCLSKIPAAARVCAFCTREVAAA